MTNRQDRQVLNTAIQGSKEHNDIMLDESNYFEENDKKYIAKTKILDNTYKKQGIKTTEIKTKIYIDKETGEEKEATQIVKRIYHNYPRGWQRVFIKDLFYMLSDGFKENKEMIILKYIFDNVDSNHRFYLSQRKVAEILGISLRKVNQTFIKLQEVNLIKKVPEISSTFSINPRIIAAYGNDKHNVELIIKYDSIPNKQ